MGRGGSQIDPPPLHPLSGNAIEEDSITEKMVFVSEANRLLFFQEEILCKKKVFFYLFLWEGCGRLGDLLLLKGSELSRQPPPLSVHAPSILQQRRRGGEGTGLSLSTSLSLQQSL